ncbi:MAG: GNAT family N-acetyltransferase [Rhodospirillales bacterium]|nr:GNAT family N-acetyltransferase [Rhodospirillales bacterium]
MPDAMPFSLVVPAHEHLPSYVAALETGWSPNTLRDVSGDQLDAIRTDADAFLRSLVPQPGETIALPDGRVVERLPGCVRWMWDGAFAGSINFRHVPGTEALPEHVLGHIGYAVVPWKRRRGYAGRALRLMLDVAREAGMMRVEICCDSDNTISRRVIERSGGVLLRRMPNPHREGRTELVFRLPCPDAST